MVQYCSDFGVTDGQTYCDVGNDNLFVCNGTELIYERHGCQGEVMSPPVCSLIVYPTNAKVGDTVTFTPTCGGESSPSSWYWTLDFGDGSSGISGYGEPFPKTHRYTYSGTFYPKISASAGGVEGGMASGGAIVITGLAVTGCTMAGEYGDREFTEGETYCDTLHNDLWKCVNGVVSRISSCNGVAEEKPDADFYPAPATGEVDQTITFYPEIGGGTPTSWDWNFGDGSLHATGSGAKTHSYSKAGYYQTVLVVSNSYGTSTRTGSMTIVEGSTTIDPCLPCTTACPDTYKCPTTIPTTKPTAKITPSAIAGAAPLVVTFKESNVVTGIISGKIDFGDGVKDSLMMGSIFHTYNTPGTYVVTYTVTNVIGSDTATTTITVSQGSVTVTPKVCSLACGTGYKCNIATGVCDKITTGTTTVECVGLNRSGDLDPTCILEKGNEIYLYGVLGVVVLLVLLKK